MWQLCPKRRKRSKILKNSKKESSVSKSESKPLSLNSLRLKKNCQILKNYFKISSNKKLNLMKNSSPLRLLSDKRPKSSGRWKRTSINERTHWSTRKIYSSQRLNLQNKRLKLLQEKVTELKRRSMRSTKNWMRVPFIWSRPKTTTIQTSIKVRNKSKNLLKTSIPKSKA